MVAFFDSGIGGLTVLQEALKQMPNEKFVYFSDGDNAPYGVKSREEVKELTLRAVSFLAAKNPKAICIACNTATSVCIEEIRAMCSMPVIGMEPAVKPAVEISKNKRVLVFATELTLKLEKFRNLVEKVDTEKRVDYLPLQELVRWAENFQFEDELILPYLKNKFAQIDFAQYSAIVLGCTHFPFFLKQIRLLVPDDIQIIDGNAGTVRNLINKIAPAPTEQKQHVQYFRTYKRKAKAGFERYFKCIYSHRKMVLKTELSC